MSGKCDKSEPKDHGGLRVLRKAKSFKADIKSRISRRTSSLTRGDSSDGGRDELPQQHTPKMTKHSHEKSPRHAKKKRVTRTGSFNEGSAATAAERPQYTDIERLEAESKKVYQAIHYLEDVVSKNTLAMLPGSVTIVLETIMEIHQLLSNFFVDQESTRLLAATKQVYQSLANLVQWADYILINGEQSLDKESAENVIKVLSDGVKELIRVSEDKLRTQAAYQSGKATLPNPNKSHASSRSIRRDAGSAAIPDIPLTQREQDILRETSALTPNTLSVEDGAAYPVTPPPPKPPLPPNRNISINVQEGDTPPLPVKRRVSSVSEPHSEVFIPASEGSSNSSLAPHRLSGEVAGVTATSPRSVSPSSDVSSLISASSEDLLEDKKSQSGSLDTSPTKTQFSLQTTDSSFGHYDNFPLQISGGRAHDINSLTDKIKQLTTDIDNTSQLSSLQFSVMDGKPPPLPDKRTNTMISVTQKSSQQRTVTQRRITSSTENISNISSVTITPPKGGVAMDASAVSIGTPSLAQMKVDGRKISTSHSTVVYSQSSSSSSSSSFRASTSTTMLSRSVHMEMSHQKMTTSHSFSGLATEAELAKDGSPRVPPPLPPKKKHVEEYMQIFGQSSSPLTQDLTRHSIHSVNFYQKEWVEYQRSIFTPLYNRSTTFSMLAAGLSDRSSDLFSVISGSSSEEGHVPYSRPSLMSDGQTAIDDDNDKWKGVGGAKLALSAADNNEFNAMVPAPALPPKNKSVTSASDLVVMRHSDPCSFSKESSASDSAIGLSDRASDSDKRSSAPISTSSSASSNRNSMSLPDAQKDVDSDFCEASVLEDMDVSDQLLWQPNGDSQEVRGGAVDALIVHATGSGKQAFLYQEAFLTTYRTFVSSRELIEKLMYRYNRYSRMADVKKKKLSRNTFSLLIRVIDELCMEVDEDLMQVLMELVYQLLCDGELMLARICRKKVLEKYEYLKNKQQKSLHTTLLSSYQLSTKQHSLLDFRSLHLAEQMTLCDAELFLKIELPEVLLYSKNQTEELSPNLTCFTEHFNKMSYWCRTKILTQEDQKDREKYLLKFIKLMKHLRSMNNFNSYLAILSALNSAPVRRLEWQNQQIDEYCDLIDSTSSFRAYRQALAETNPPCIPYIGIVLQDLTFIHIGNPDTFPDSNVNFAKRWQQFNILDNMRRFHKAKYMYSKNHKILQFFNNFEDYICEESLWQISKTIKP